ncbi:hypothetical protein TNCV_3076371 [Trichonephila clavipes]|nr:hypothetical protein TNCV_3076371 [Trichonephila clavipes]
MLTKIAESIHPVSSQMDNLNSTKFLFDLSTSPGVFQRYVSSIFRDLTPGKGIVISYLDDLAIPAKKRTGRSRKNSKIIFEVAKEIRIRKLSSRSVALLKKEKLKFLGHIVESETIKPSPITKDT